MKCPLFKRKLAVKLAILTSLNLSPFKTTMLASLTFSLVAAGHVTLCLGCDWFHFNRNPGNFVTPFHAMSVMCKISTSILKISARI